MLPINLQLFSEAAEAPQEAAGQAGLSPGDEAAQKALDELKQKRAKKGKERIDYVTPQEQAQQVAPAQEQTDENARPTFDELIKGDYKADYDKNVQAIVKDRVKNLKGAQETLEALNPMLERLYKQYGVDNAQELVNKYLDDDSLYEQAAIERGVPIEVEKELQQLQRNAAILEQRARRRDMEEQFQSHIQSLVEQGEKLKEVFPGFNLQAEFNNPEFVRLTSPEVGLDVETAYRVIHKDEIDKNLMQSALKKGARQVSNAVQAGIMRPSENGVGGAGGAVVLSSDPRDWDKKVLKQIAEDAKRGKKIIL